MDEVYLYKWNRKYPSDVKFPKDMLNDFKLEVLLILRVILMRKLLKKDM